MTTTLSPWQHAQELFAAHLDGYQDRPQQTGLALKVTEALGVTTPLLGQAGCGTGKTLSTAIPAIYWSLENGMPVVITTATKALMDQVANKDLPFLQKLLAEAGVDFTYVVVKGRSNYLCKAKLNEPEVRSLSYYNSLTEELEAAGENFTGDLDSLITPVDPRDRQLLTSTTDECPGNDCPLKDACFAERAKIKARTAQIIVTNHALLITDANVKAMSNQEFGLLPRIGAVIVDEAHKLEDYTTSMLGAEFTNRGIEKLSSDVVNLFEDHKLVGPLLGATKTLFSGLESLLRREKTARLGADMLGEDGDGLLGDALQDVADALHTLAKAVEREEVHGDDRKLTKKRRLLRRLTGLRGKILGIKNASSDELVRWVERDDRGVTLKFAPLHVGAFLRENVWSHAEIRGAEDRIAVPARPRPSVLVSATLSTTPGDFSFIARALGLDEMGYEGFDAGTPFDYRKQARLLVPAARTKTNPRGMAEPSGRDAAMWRSQAQTTMRELVHASGGRTLILFTSTSAMKEAYEALADGFDEQGYTPYMQGQYSNPVLAERFKADERSVLFALESFMTGFDVQGDALRTVIIDKMPFAVPTDVINTARCEAANRRVVAKYGVSPDKAQWHPEGAFFGLTVPAATLTIMQAVGRLIRTTTDEGLMVCLDVRLETKGYGKKVLSALPPAPRLHDLAEARSYLGELAARRD